MLFFLGETMEKTEKNKEKDRKRTEGKIWIDEHTPYCKRRCGSGLTFGGRYIREDQRR